MTMDDPLYRRQTHSGAIVIFCAVQPLEHAKQFVGIAHIKPHTIVPNKKDSLVAILLAADDDVRLVSFAGKFQGIAQ